MVNDDSEDVIIAFIIAILMLAIIGFLIYQGINWINLPEKTSNNAVVVGKEFVPAHMVGKIYTGDSWHLDVYVSPVGGDDVEITEDQFDVITNGEPLGVSYTIGRLNHKPWVDAWWPR
jgi:hypothetical protein